MDIQSEPREIWSSNQCCHGTSSTCSPNGASSPALQVRKAYNVSLCTPIVSSRTNLTSLCFRSETSKATYIGVIVGVVGTVALLSLGICLDIWRRRRRSLARQRDENQEPRNPSFHAQLPRHPVDALEPDNSPMQEHQSYSPLTQNAPLAPTSAAMPQAVYSGATRSKSPDEMPPLSSSDKG